jgi:hypothetical protein
MGQYDHWHPHPMARRGKPPTVGGVLLYVLVLFVAIVCFYRCIMPG